jgi:Cu/Ag efflux pump CusA
MSSQSNKRIHLLLLAGGLAVLVVVGLAIAGFFLRARLLAAREPIRIELLAYFPGSSAEEVERQVAIPLEVTLAGMERLEALRSKSLAGVACLQAEFNPGATASEARQAILDRLTVMTVRLPDGVNPQISPVGAPEGTFRYTLHSPQDPAGRDLYTLHDLRTLQDWVLEREFRRVPRILDVTSCGGTVRRYELHPDPERLRRYGVTLTQLEKVVADSNGNVGHPLDAGGGLPLSVRAIGLFGGGKDPLQKALTLDNPVAAAAHLRGEEQARLREIRSLVITSINNHPVRIADIVEGGPLLKEASSTQGVVVGYQPRQGQVGVSRPYTIAEGVMVRDAQGNIVWVDSDDCVEGVVHLRRGEDAQIAWQAVRNTIEQLNSPGKTLPGVHIEPYLEGAGSPEHFWVRAHFPVTVSQGKAAALARRAREVVRSYPEVERVVSEVGGSEGGTLLGGSSVGRLCVTLRPAAEWPNVPDKNRPRTKAELRDALAAELERQVAEVGWDCLSQYRDDLSDEFAGSADEAVLKILGPDLAELEKLAGQIKGRLEKVEGVRSVRLLAVRGLPHLTWRIDPDKCARWGISVADVKQVLQCALEGRTISKMMEDDKVFDITLFWPAAMRRDQEAILAIPLEVVNNQGTPLPGAAPGDDPIGHRPRLRLRDVISPLGENGAPDEKGALVSPGFAAIYRENGHRVLLLRVGVRGRAQSAVRTEGERSLAPLLTPGYRLDWDCGR